MEGSPDIIKMNYSVITACLNSSETIGKAIKSVLSQDPLPLEYYFVDGASQDGTVGVIESLLEGNPTFSYKIIHQTEKTGITGAWNLALSKVKGDVVFILNSDDWYEADAAKSVLDCFCAYPEAGVVLGDACFHEVSGEKHVRGNRNFKFFPLLMPVIHPACFVKREVYEKQGCFDQRYRISADYEFTYRCFRNGVKFHEIRKPIVNMLLGGAANRNRRTARIETYQIAKKYSTIPILPEIAYLARYLSGR